MLKTGDFCIIPVNTYKLFHRNHVLNARVGSMFCSLNTLMPCFSKPLKYGACPVKMSRFSLPCPHLIVSLQGEAMKEALTHLTHYNITVTQQ